MIELNNPSFKYPLYIFPVVLHEEMTKSISLVIDPFTWFVALWFLHCSHLYHYLKIFHTSSWKLWETRHDVFQFILLSWYLKFVLILAGKHCEAFAGAGTRIRSCVALSKCSGRYIWRYHSFTTLLICYASNLGS